MYIKKIWFGADKNEMLLTYNNESMTFVGKLIGYEDFIN